jgi:hypothetical protein
MKWKNCHICLFCMLIFLYTMGRCNANKLLSKSQRKPWCAWENIKVDIEEIASEQDELVGFVNSVMNY